LKTHRFDAGVTKRRPATTTWSTKDAQSGAVANDHRDTTKVRRIRWMRTHRRERRTLRYPRICSSLSASRARDTRVTRKRQNHLLRSTRSVPRAPRLCICNQTIIVDLLRVVPSSWNRDMAEAGNRTTSDACCRGRDAVPCAPRVQRTSILTRGALPALPARCVKSDRR